MSFHRLARILPMAVLTGIVSAPAAAAPTVAPVSGEWATQGATARNSEKAAWNACRAHVRRQLERDDEARFTPAPVEAAVSRESQGPRYRFTAYVDAGRATEQLQRRWFTCTIQYEVTAIIPVYAPLDLQFFPDRPGAAESGLPAHSS